MFLRKGQTKKKKTVKKVSDTHLNNKEFHKATQNLIWFEHVYEDGIIEFNKPKSKKRINGRYGIIVHFSDINYIMLSEEEQKTLLASYVDFLTQFGSSVDVQIMITNFNVNKNRLIKALSIPPHGNKNDVFVEQYNETIIKKIFENRKLFERNKYIILSINANSYEDAKLQLDRLASSVVSQLLNLHSNPHRLNQKEVLKLYHRILRPDENFVDNKSLEMGDQRTVIAPAGVKLGPNYFELYNNDITPTYWSLLVLRDYPTTLIDSFVKDLSMQSFDVILSIFIRTIDQHKAVEMVNNRLKAIKAEIFDIQKHNKGFGDYVIPFRLSQSLQETEELLTNLTSGGERLFYVTLTVGVSSDNKKELKENSKEVVSIGLMNGANFVTLPFLPKETFNTLLPEGKSFLPVEGTERLLVTTSTAILIPFTALDRNDEDGLYYGINSITNVPVIINRADPDKFKSPNGFILGTPGSGKSFFAKKEALAVYLKRVEDDIIIIDPEAEYVNMCKTLGGTVIDVRPGTNTHINPLDITENYAGGEGTGIELKLGFILSMMRIIMGSNISATQKSLIDRALRMTYQKKGIEYKRYVQAAQSQGKPAPDKSEFTPTLQDFFKTIQSMIKMSQSRNEKEDLYQIASSLDIYVTGTFSLFANKTNIDISNRFTVFNIKDLPNEMKTLGMLVVLDQIWNRISLNRERKKRTWVVIDEIYLLYSNEYSANFLYELFKRSRKWGAIITGITQNVEDMLRSDIARTMLANAEFLVLFNQSPSDIEIVQSTLKLSSENIKYIMSTQPGRGLMILGHSPLPFYDEFPHNSSLYKLMTTKPTEM